MRQDLLPQMPAAAKLSIPQPHTTRAQQTHKARLTECGQGASQAVPAAQHTRGGPAPRQLPHNSRQIIAGPVRIAHPRKLLQEPQVRAAAREVLGQEAHIHAQQLHVGQAILDGCSAPKGHDDCAILQPAQVDLQSLHPSSQAKVHTLEAKGVCVYRLRMKAASTMAQDADQGPTEATVAVVAALTCVMQT